MQRGDTRKKRRERFTDRERRGRNMARPQQGRPKTRPILTAYLVRMRNGRDPQRGAWATFAKRAREGAGLSQSELARQIGVDRVTVYRWETDKQRPDSLGTVQAFAQALDIDVDEALAAAGMKLCAQPPAAPSKPVDPEVEIIRNAKISDSAKRRLIERMVQRRLRDQEARVADLEDLIRAQEALER